MSGACHDLCGDMLFAGAAVAAIPGCAIDWLDPDGSSPRAVAVIGDDGTVAFKDVAVGSGIVIGDKGKLNEASEIGTKSAAAR
jgi:hypothetical protein